MAIVRSGTTADFEQLMIRCAQSFSDANPNHLLFEDLYPDSIRPGPDSMSQWMLAVEGDAILAGMQVVPRPQVIAGCIELPAAGLGNVFCFPTARQQGHMSMLLQTVVESMKGRGYALCMLGGDRLRYGRFGWENAGNSRNLSLRGNMMRNDEESSPSILEVRRWRGTAADTDRMHEAYCKLPYHSVRTRDEFELVMQRPGHVVWLCDSPELGFAYVSLTGSRVAEYAGDSPAAERLVRFLASRRAVDVSVPPAEGEGPLEKMLLRYAAHYSIECVGMVRIVDMAKTLEAYRPVVERRLEGWRGSLAIRCSDAPEEFAVDLQGTDQGLVLDIGRADSSGNGHVLELRLRDAARLLFGPFPPALGDMADAEPVRRLFPLPLYWHPLSHV